MIDKKFILNADDFGLGFAQNQAVLEGYVNGFLSSASLCANGDAFDNAVNDVLPDCPNLSVGVHLNIMEGKSLTGAKSLTDSDGNFNKSYLYYLWKRNDVEVLDDIKEEFIAQVERILEHTKVSHIDSHVHVHAIPSIFEIVCKIAHKYEIPYIRTQHEELYFVPKFEKHLNLQFPMNLLKVALLNYFTKSNKETADVYDLKTNDFLLGVGYSGLMDSQTVEYGLRAIEEESLTEALIHPRKYDSNLKDSHTKEFSITQNMKLKECIEKLGFELTNFNDLK
ncbi:MAG: ChbG/HpnK family deacetylase [Cyanobacteriota bacterium]|nr:ChbG/HpnK family deacetylase [Cyanobacteriota bacterium]MDY6357885.1 ChbG/HpnK family deacetylase [Cyanobacteriota bacterium]MDY6364233.1 ChbG/HpnK family deacetylase [Cyanobacteriota bacterium]MDY6383167.1 ChbG/HpnK family deacetylase [Cyanobacteriota bacterium]